MATLAKEEVGVEVNGTSRLIPQFTCSRHGALEGRVLQLCIEDTAGRKESVDICFLCLLALAERNEVAMIREAGG